MTQLIAGDDWPNLFSSFRRTAWRLESQGIYREPYEQEPLRQFLAGQKPDLSFMDDHVATVRADTAAGKRWQRVRVLTEPLTDYLRFEMSIAWLNAEAGEEIRVLTESQARDLGIPRQDFWMLDDDQVAAMHFGDQGFEYAELVTEPAAVEPFRKFRELAWQNATPFGEHQMT
jgi:hypothetical protein